jgi:isoleucyl-tRNA synthetase
VIWTTTAWTIPANQALNLNPRWTTRWSTPSAACWCWPRSLVEKCLQRYGLQGTVLATCLGEKLGGMAFRHPLAHVDAGYDR